MSEELHVWFGTPRRVFSNGLQALITPLTFGRGRICVGKKDDLGIDISY